MAIDAVIAAVTVIAPSSCKTCNMTGRDPDDAWSECPACYGATESNPCVRLKLEARDDNGVECRTVLTIVNPPTTDPNILAGLVGTEIWGGSLALMVGDRKWADRIGYTQIQLVDKP